MPKKWVPEKKHVVGKRPALPPGVVKSAGRVLQILEFFDDVRREVNVIEMCTVLGYPQSSTSALLRSLVLLGVLNYNRVTRLYSPTIRMALLGSWVSERLFGSGQLLRMTEAINRRTGQAVLVATRNGRFAKYIHVVQATKLARLHITLGTERPLAASGTGYAILSTYPDAEVRKIVHAINAYTTAREEVISIADLLPILARIRKRGYSYVPNLVTSGGGVIAIPLPTIDQTQPLVVGVGGVADVLTEHEREIVAIMREEMRTYLDTDGSEETRLQVGL
jgi:DNA-binding IclR family transcriptional regulator